jgi:penicillin-binding protein 1A
MNSSIPLHQPVPTPSTNVALFLFKVFLKGLALVVFLILSVAGGLATGAYFRLSTLPDVGKLQYYNAHERSEVVTLDGKVLTQIFGEENRKVLLLKDIPKHVSGAVLAIEDARWYLACG